MKDSVYHKPVMLAECIDALNIKGDGVYVDTTFGGGGHSKEILKHLTKGTLIGFDRDADAAENKMNDEHFVFINQNFIHLKRYLKLNGFAKVDGILADLGISSHQIDTAGRGFSTRYEAELDMRMDRSSELTAKEILNTYSAEQLQQMLSEYGEVRNAKTLAQHIVTEREKKFFTTTQDFIARIGDLVKGKESRYLAQVFQALRIEVNRELEALEQLLQQSAEVLNEGGRMVVLTYHSLEDRIVKNFFRSGNVKGEIKKDVFGNFSKQFEVMNRKPITAGAEEVKANPRARSAKLRIAERMNS